MRRLAPFVILVGLLVILVAAATPPTVLDDFEDPTRWEAVPSDGVSLSLASDAGFRGRAMRLDFDFHGKSGWAAVRRKVSLEMPANYEFSFRIRGEAPVNNLEFKLADESGQNVWWSNRRNFEFPREWTRIAVKKRHISFAWGPAERGELARAASLEITVTAGSGGKGSVWLDELTFEKLPPARPYTRTPKLQASSAAAGHEAGLALDGNPATAWRSAGAAGGEWLSLDFLEGREYGGLVITWEGAAFARNYTVEISDDGLSWTTVREVAGGNGGRDYLFLPESESRFVRLRLGRGGGKSFFGIREIAVEPLDFSASANAFFEAVAKDAPRGFFPRYFSGEQSYWTIVGVDGDAEEGLVSEDAALEAGKGGFSIEPLLFADGALSGWSDAHASQSLAQGYLPIPSVTWHLGALTLETTAVAAGPPSRSSLYVRYRLRNAAVRSRSLKLFLAIRPLQVDPPTQFLNHPGGATPIRVLRWDGREAKVDARRILPITPPSAFGASTFDQGEIVESLARGNVPGSTAVEDSFGYASGAFAYEMQIAPRGEKVVDLAIPLHAESRPATGRRAFDDALAGEIAEWRSKLDRVAISVPARDLPMVRTLKTTLAYVLINRDGPAIQPGSRSYERSWIRDGSLTSAALLRLGHPEPVAQFVEWYASHQFKDGKIPCCVDARGADPVPENDSHGEFLYAIAEYGRYTKDRDLLSRLWPRVEKTVGYIEKLRMQRRTGEYGRPEKVVFFGLLPESISHEGYSARPVHSYWDDFFALRGLRDAAEIAALLGKTEQQNRYRALADEFESDVLTSIRRTIAEHAIEYIPGSVELADFDPTSTTIAIEPGGELDRLPRRELLATFERYFGEFRRRASTTWDAYTPYEMRIVGTFVRLGWRDRAHELLGFFLQDRRPAAWNQWAEVVGRESRRARFIGDMPHTWVGSDYIRSFLDLFAYARESDRCLVLAAGIPERWLDSPEGVAVKGLPTPYGELDYSFAKKGVDLLMNVSGKLDMPPGGLWLALPEKVAARIVTVNGRPCASPRGDCVIRELPARVIVH
ncbi:MAG TPA: discoidin domain-containing protein [Thermoanaerobaculia bacterium]|nr:discoidin domain-containing protein [Thermoanaerobaculia bacterium]